MFRSLYTRIAVGFVALLAIGIAIQGLLFLWLTDRFMSSPEIRTPQHLADHVARELSDALTENPALDLDAHVRARFGSIFQPFAVVMRDGRRASNRPSGLPPGFPRSGGRRVREPWGSTRESGPGGRGDRDGRGAAGAVTAPIVVNGAQEGFVAVPGGPPPVSVALRELGPTLTWTGLGLLLAGATVAALFIFRPTHRRLRSLEQASRALGEGRTDVRADESGGDEVTALARAFNRMADDLQARATALAASDNARRQLLADVSHELMTPLTAIRGYVQTLAMPDVALDAETRRRYLEIADRETYKLETMIGDLLDMARLEGGGGALTFERIPVAELFRRVLERHGPSVEARGIALTTEIVPPALQVRGDPERLEQALQNVAANAVRHTPDGGRVDLAAKPFGDGVQITVRDTGPGIPAEHLAHVFDRFYKADAARAPTTTGGSGLGLSIVRAIVERHGGSVSAANGTNGGAVIELTLPDAATSRAR
jgi:signal transduction histidine kinase